MKQPKIIAMIPARIGSTRLKMKNLALIDGKPMIYYTIKAAQESGIFDRIILNSDSKVFEAIADRYGVEFYHRPEELGSSTTKSDDVVLDFIKKNSCNIVVWVNPTSPLQTGSEIKTVIDYFQKEKLDSLITVENKLVHTIWQNKPINFVENDKFAQTQDLIPVQPFVYSIMMWRTSPFVEAMKEKGYAFFTGKVGFHPVSKETGIIIKTAEDLRLIDYIVRARKESNEIQYDPIIKEVQQPLGD
jgi:CMP-N-acetylneuraminic acid synthetase